LALALRAQAADQPPLPGTARLDWQGDIASRLLDAADEFLLAETQRSIDRRAQYWKRDFTSPEKYQASIEPNRKRLAHILGVRDPRVPFDAPELVGTTTQPALVARANTYQVFAVRWPAFADVHGEGLLLVPTGKPVANVIAIPDADQTPEMLCGLAPGMAPESQFARRLAENGCRVLVPVLINRQVTYGQLSNREVIYRGAYELGRHIIGYELQKILAGVDWFAKEGGGGKAEGGRGKADADRPKIGVIGWGEGGMLALYAAALDTRIDVACVSGYFDSRQDLWQEPLYRNVFGLLEQFGDAELAAMIAPRWLIVQAAEGPQVVVPPKTGGGPGRLTTPDEKRTFQEFNRAGWLIAELPTSKPRPLWMFTAVGLRMGPYGSAAVVRPMVERLGPSGKLAPVGEAPKDLRGKFDPAPRHRAQMHELERHNQWWLTQCFKVRREFMKGLDTSSLANYEKSVKHYRDFFYDEVIGRFPYRPLEPNPRTRQVYDAPKWTGYEVVLDVFPGLFAYGVLLVPKDIRPGQKRPVVVCQHGLEGRPADVIEGDSPYYHGFAARLAERGFVTFAPQNLYLQWDRFRTLQRKANPIKKTLYSLIVPQHQQIVDWLGTLPFVDPQRIGFYGLSYGGKTAMRVPALVTNYCLSICSGDFNEWVWKNVTADAPFTYLFSPEYEIFEFDLGSTFNYAEMAALIAPRPFMVERGHFDGVSWDEAVAYEYAKVRFLYAAKLHIPERTEIEWFVGPHMINGKGTYEFLHKHLGWPKPADQAAK
jgi:dienelactone hydrolase